MLLLWFYHHTRFINYFFTNDAGKDPHGNELYAGIWVCGGFSEVIMEVWTPRGTLTLPGMLLFHNLYFVSICSLLLEICNY